MKNRRPVVVEADMSDFALGRTFDLVYASANTVRCVTNAEHVACMWECVARHLRPGGVFACDVELGFTAEAGKVGERATWSVSRERDARTGNVDGGVATKRGDALLPRRVGV